MEQKTKPKDTIELNQSDMQNLSNGLKEFSGSIKTHISELKEINQDLASISDLGNGLNIEAQSRKFDSQQLFSIILGVHAQIIKTKGNKKLPSGVG